MNNLFVSNLKRAFCSKRFVLATVGTTIISFASSHTYLSDGQSSAYVLDLLLNLSMFKKLIVFFAALPFVTVFCQDFGSGFIKSIVIRSNEKSYVLSSIIAVALSGFSAVFVGIMSYFAIVSFYVPCIPYETAGTYSSIAFNNPVLFVFVLVSIFSLYASMWTIAGLALSSVLPDKYIALGSPLILGYLLEELTSGLPKYFNLYKLSHAGGLFNNAILDYIYAIGVFVLGIVFWGFIFSYFTKRRLRNELV